ncbi:MAG: putative ABC transporter ATP-binding protein YbiT [Chlamydiales bacterium]|nr:putative ABC transporter ATP-binding protein YbiT [Chlamydiales bacterium]
MPIPLIQVSNLSKSFDNRLLFHALSLSIHEGEAIALIGANGSGKTTLLELLVGSILPDSGQVSRSPHLSIGYLPQEVSVGSCSVKEYLQTGPLTELEARMAACLEQADRLEEWEQLHEQYAQLGGYRRLPVEKVLKGLKLDLSLLEMSMESLSSGQKVRCALGKALLENPQLLLLDEPTNHLDSEMLNWLEVFLQQREGATLIVSHDRKFLNHACNHLLEIREGQLFSYGGSYDFFLDEQKRMVERKMRAYAAQQEEKKRLKQKIKALTFAKGNPSAPSDRNVMAYDKRGEHHQKSTQRTLNDLKTRLKEIETHPLVHPKPKTIKGLQFEGPPLATSVAIELDQVSKSFEKHVLFSGLSHVLRKGERVLLTGPNGAGKTSLLRCLVGELPLDSGEIRYARTAQIGYLDQEVERFPMEKTPLEYFADRFQLTEEDLRRELHKAALGGAELLNRAFLELSVGQRKRLVLLVLVLEKPNILLLDEPTNHLDFLTLEALETALLKFEGAVLAISHDAMFREKMGAQEWRLY